MLHVVAAAAAANRALLRFRHLLGTDRRHSPYDEGRAGQRKPAAPARKLSYKEQRELEELPGRIEALEAEQKALGERLASNELYTNEPQRAGELQARYAQIEEALMAALERWELLGSR